MKVFVITALALPLLALAAAQERPGGADGGIAVPAAAAREGVRVSRAGSQASTKGPAEWFTGVVRIDPLFAANAPSRGAGASVTFEPGARTAWHTHPLGQTLVVTAGVGRVQGWGGAVQEIRPGDVVWIPAGQKHWHGAAPTTAMTHLAIHEALDGYVGWPNAMSAMGRAKELLGKATP